MRRGGRSVLRMVLLSLLLGVVTTYGVAWGLMNLQRPNPRLGIWQGNILHHMTTGWLCFHEDKFGTTWTVGEVLQERGRGLNGFAPRWSLVHRKSPIEISESAAGQRVYDGIRECAAGWPCRAVIRREWEANGVAELIQGHDLTVRTSCLPGTEFAFMPIWPGFALDVVLYGLAWTGAWWGMHAVKSRNRYAAGLCVRCRYDLKGLTSGVCPECGRG